MFLQMIITQFGHRMLLQFCMKFSSGLVWSTIFTSVNICIPCIGNTCSYVWIIHVIPSYKIQSTAHSLHTCPLTKLMHALTLEIFMLNNLLEERLILFLFRAYILETVFKCIKITNRIFYCEISTRDRRKRKRKKNIYFRCYGLNLLISY